MQTLPHHNLLHTDSKQNTELPLLFIVTAPSSRTWHAVPPPLLTVTIPAHTAHCVSPVAQARRSGPSLSAVAQRRRSAPSLSPVAQRRRSAPSLSPVAHRKPVDVH